MKKITLIALMLFTALCYAQVGINTNNPDASSALEIESTTGGILIPRLTETQRDAISAPATGLMIYQTNGTSGFYFYDGNIWTKVDGVAGPQGTDGADGTDGVDGTDGTDGADGTDGVDGVDGANGTDGVAGATGATGPTGPQGDAGIDGVDGTDGTDGADGVDILGNTTETLYYGVNGWIATDNLTNDGTTVNTNSDMSINGVTVGKGGGNIISNTASGSDALNSNTTGVQNTASGNQALNANTTGNNNTASGNYALYSNTLGYANTASGNEALSSNTTGSQNTASGNLALYSNTTGYNNTASGNAALASNTTGEENTASGRYALYSNTTGYENTASGNYALNSNTTGFQNTAFGFQALSANTTESNNIGIGYDAQVSNSTGSNQVRIGNSSITYAGIQVAWTTTSDKRWKSDIQNSSLGLNFISKLRPVSYYRNNDESKKIEYGFIAQELEAALDNEGAKNNSIISIDDQGMYGVRYNDLISPMVKAIQEQQEMINTLQKENKEFKERIVQLEKK